MKTPSARSAALKIVVTGLLLLLVFKTVDVSKILQDLRSLAAERLIMFVLAFWIGQLLCAQRWRLFASSLGMHHNYGTFVQMYSIGMVFNIGLPSLVGGDVVKAAMLGRRTPGTLQSGLASVLQDRAAGMLSLLIYGTAATLAFPMTWRGVPLWFLYLLTWSGVAAVIWVVWMGENLYLKLRRPESHTPLQKIIWLIADFHHALGTMRLSSGAILQVVIYSFINSAIVLCMFQQISEATGHAVDLVSFSALFPLISLATMLPISLGGLGIREWAYVEALSLAGVSSSGALLTALTTSALIIVCNLTGVPFLLSIPAELRSQTPSILETMNDLHRSKRVS